jgi:signal transduction histidine kinase/FixJ family two-component response regulator
VAEPGAPPGGGEAPLRDAIDEIADQLCQAVDGRFDFTVRSSADDETAEKLAMLINFVLGAVGRGLRELEASNARLRELDRLKSRFLTNVSHELRTPLALVLGPVDAALEAPLGERARPQLERARRNALRLASAVDDLLDFVRLEAGSLKPQPEPVDVAALARRFADDARDVAAARGLALEAGEPAGGGATTLALDRKMVEKIVANLVSNALKFTPEGGRIQISVGGDDGGVTLRVDDTGVGIDPAKQGLLFQRFQQIDPSATRHHGGLGVGLALVKEFAELMGGAVGVESEPGRGSSFWVRFPRQAPASALTPAPDGAEPAPKPFLPPAPPLAVREASGGAADAPRPEFTFDRPRVLVAEDNDELRAFLVELLSGEYDVVACADGVEAFEAARRLRPDAVLSDVLMPRLDGTGLVARLKAEPSLRHIPVVLLTAQADRDAAVTALDGGADDYLGKPFSPAELRARLRVALRLARAYRREALLADELAETRDLVVQLAVTSFARKHADAIGGALRAPLARVRALVGDLAGPEIPSVALRAALDELAGVAEGIAQPSETLPDLPPAERVDLAAELRELGGRLPPAARARLAFEEEAGPCPRVFFARDDLRAALAHIVDAFARRRPGPIVGRLRAVATGAHLELSTAPAAAALSNPLDLELIYDERGVPRPDLALVLAKQLFYRNGASLRVDLGGDGALVARATLPPA